MAGPPFWIYTTWRPWDLAGKTAANHFSFGRSLNTIDSLEASSHINLRHTLGKRTNACLYISNKKLWRRFSSWSMVRPDTIFGLKKNRKDSCSEVRKKPNRPVSNPQFERSTTLRASKLNWWGCSGYARLSHARLVTCDFYLDVVTQHNRLADFLVHTKWGFFL